MTMLRSGEKKDVNLAVRSSSFFLLLPPPNPLTLFLSFQPRSLRLICVKSRRNSSTGFFPERVRIASCQGRRQQRVAPRARVCVPAFVRDEDKLSQFHWRALDRHFACGTRTHATHAFSRRLVASGANDERRRFVEESLIGGRREIFKRRGERQGSSVKERLCTTCLSSIFFFFFFVLDCRCGVLSVSLRTCLFLDTEYIFDRR